MKDIKVIIPEGFALAIYVEGELIAVSVRPTVNNIALAIKEHGSLDSVVLNPEIDRASIKQIVWVDETNFTFFQMDGLDENYVGCEESFELVHIY